MEQEIKDAIEEYYRLKNIYDLKNNQDKKKILRDKDLYKISKKQALAALKPVCVSCGKVGGTIFRQDETKLYAICNAVSRCTLDIEIDRGKYEKLTDLFKIVTTNFEESRSDIIKTKLNMLFGYITEEQAAAIFAGQKEDFDESQKEIKYINDKFVDIIQNGRYSKSTIEIKGNIEKIKSKISEYTKLYDDDSRNASFVSDIVQTYINELYPEVKKLRTTVYAKNEIECADGMIGPLICEDEMYRLVQEPYLYSETDMEMTSPVIIKNFK